MKDQIIKKLENLIEEANALLILIEEQKQNWSDDSKKAFNESKFFTFKTSTLSFLNTILGKDSLYYGGFKNRVQHFTDYNLVLAIELLEKIKDDVKDGWLKDIKSLLSAELFNDFLEMAEHLLAENYKDAAAVIIGSVLEKHLRTLCLNNKIEITTTDPQTHKVKSKKAETLNTDLCKAGVYNVIVQKAVTSWLAIRNNAAHANYNEYDLPQVKNLLQSVVDFTAKFL